MMMKKFYLILTCVTLCAFGGGNKQQAVQSDGSFTASFQTYFWISILNNSHSTIFHSPMVRVAHCPLLMIMKFKIVPTFSTYWNFLFH